jgi:hypothetical protein
MACARETFTFIFTFADLSDVKNKTEFEGKIGAVSSWKNKTEFDA